MNDHSQILETVYDDEVEELDPQEREFLENVSWDTDSEEEDYLRDEWNL